MINITKYTPCILMREILYKQNKKTQVQNLKALSIA